MKRLIVLGSTGMLGSQITRTARESGLSVIEISRSGPIVFDAAQGDIFEILEELNVSPDDWVVNCIGWIPQKSSGEPEADRRQARLLNTDLIASLARAKNGLKFGWIQIGTDCVYPGTTGSYSETSVKVATDLYSQTKIDGEQFSELAIQVRCSIIGPEPNSASSLYSWFKAEAWSTNEIFGYVNQTWNGVSTFAFARLVVGLVWRNISTPMIQNWVPSDSVSKYQLLMIFANCLGLPKTRVQPLEMDGLNRTLITNSEENNRLLWGLAGYNETPSIQALCEEFIAQDIKIRGAIV